MKFKNSFYRFLSLFLLISSLFSSMNFYVFADESFDIDADTMYTEGKRYLVGDGVDQDVSKGVSMILSAADAGSGKAMIDVGLMYSSGLGRLLSPDYKEGDEAELALSWYERGAEAGEVELAAAALSSDAFSYFLGSEDGRIKEDDATALKYFLKAAEYGNADAINMVVAFYSFGFGVDQDPEKALELCSKLADQGNAEALYSMEDYAYAYYAGTKDGIDINFNTSFLYYEKLTEYGNERAMYNLGLLYEYGLGTAQDHEKAIEWLTKANESGYEPAGEMLSKLSSNNE